MAKLAPHDCSLLAVLQLIQPATLEEIIAEMKDIPYLSSLKKALVKQYLQRLLGDGFIVEAQCRSFIVSPLGYFLVKQSLTDKKRDQARLLYLNNQRFL